MKVVAVLFAVLAVALAAPPSVQDPKLAVVTKYDNENIGVGEYSFHVEQSDGQIKEEQGQLVNPGSENEAVAAHGSFSFVGTDGVTYQITYTADENGFQPQGAHIPK